jgi:Holliday junction resolvasome RuvABC ATP-dependent DNA helicase subunit
MLNDATRAAFGADLVGQRARLAQEAGVRDQGQAIATPKPVGAADRTRNPLRPRTFDEVVGQDDAKRMLRRVVNQARLTGQPLDHTLLVGPSGTGKSTFSNVIANELGVEVYEVEAPVSHETLLALRTAMSDRDILRIEEIHQQAIMERRGRGAATEPEVLYNVLEDRTIVSGTGVLQFPEITVIGTTTDEGLLPDPFLNRFPLRPRLERYSREQLVDIGGYNAQALGMKAEREALELFADAGRGITRQINNYVRNAKSLDSGEGIIHLSLAEEVVFDLNGVTRDGLTPDMAAMLVFIYEKGKRTTAQGETYYQASVGSVAVGIGKSRDVKAITLRVEGYLIEQGWLQVTHGGRRLTDAGIERARQLCGS